MMKVQQRIMAFAAFWPHLVRERLFAALARRGIVQKVTTGLVVSMIGHATYADRFGSAVVTVGDLNSDGHPEIAVSDPLFMGASGKGRCGRVWIFDPQTKQILMTFNGKEAGDLFGVSLIAPGDLDGDDVPDLVIGTTCQGVDTIGRPETISTTVTDIGDGYVSVMSLGKNKRLYDVPTTRGAIANIWDAVYPFPSLAVLDDLNQDGVADFAVGSPYDGLDDRDHCGSVRIYSGADGSAIEAAFGDAPHAHLGGRVIQAGDLSGDHKNDLLVSGGGLGCEEVFGINNPEFVWGLSSVDLDRVVTIDPKDSDYSGSFGGTLCALDDVNEDGIPDIAIGGSARGHTPIFRYSGTDGLLLGKWKKHTERIGLEVLSLGDVNGDGFSDLGLSCLGGLGASAQTLLVIVSGASDEVLGQVSNPESQISFPGISLSAYKKNAKGVVTELLIGTASYRSPPHWPGAVYLIDIPKLKVIRSFSREDLRR